MRIKIQQFLFGKSYSWSIVGQNIGRSLINLGHNVEFVSTDGVVDKYVPNDLKPYIKKLPTGKYDAQISYTAMINFHSYLSHGDKNRFGIFAFEFNGKNVLPEGFAKHYKFTDKMLPPSEFCKDVFVNGGVPSDHQVVVPHGINLADYDDKEKLPLRTNKKYKIGLIIGQPHGRKNIPGALRAFGEAFTKNDDVCLVAKVLLDNKTDHQFCIDFISEFKSFKRKYPNHAEIELITGFVPNMIHLYNACDSVFTMSNCEGFYMPGLEIIGCNKLNIAPRYGGQLDFLNDNNSLLIGGEIVRAPKKYMYWASSSYAEMFKPSIEEAVGALRKSYNEYDELMEKFMPNILETKNKYTWDNVAKQIIELCVG